MEIKQPEHEAGQSHSFGAKAKNGWNYAYTPPYAFMLWYLLRHSGSLIFFVWVSKEILSLQVQDSM
jgi:hypothetical protein